MVRGAAGRRRLPRLARRTVVVARAGAQLWPIGFGGAREAELTRLAALSQPLSCGNGAKLDPQAVTVVGDSSQLLDAVLEAYSAATCIRLHTGVTQSLASGATLEETVDIHQAAVSLIIVRKGAADVMVSYRDPHGTLLDSNNPTFEFTGKIPILNLSASPILQQGDGPSSWVPR